MVLTSKALTATFAIGCVRSQCLEAMERESLVSQCTSCGSTSYGPGCVYASNGNHDHAGDSTACRWCGSTSYGPGCVYAPDPKNHRRGSGGGACTWCGSTSF